jgi:hypothetical protein
MAHRYESSHPQFLKDFREANRLGQFERFNILRNHVKFHNNVQVAATYNIPQRLLQTATIDVLQTLIFAALKETLNHQPIMGVTIADEGSPEPKWRRLAKIDLGEVVKIVDTDPKSGMDEWVREGHGLPFERPDELPLWRVTVAAQKAAITKGDSDVISFTVGFFYHHAIGDGLSGGAFHLTFLDALNALLSGKIKLPIDITEAAIVSPPNLPLVPNIEIATRLPVSILFVLKQIINTYVYSPIDPLNWSGPAISSGTPRPPVTQIRSFSLPVSIVTALLALCRREKTTITALLTTLTARRLSTLYPTHSRFTATVPFSLRKFSGHKARDMGCFVSNIEPYFSSEVAPPRGYISCRSTTGSEESRSEIGDEELWASARATKRVIDAKTANIKDQNVSLLKFVSDFPGFFYGKLGSKRENAFEISNIGVLDGGALGDGSVGGHGGEGKPRVCFDRVLFSASQVFYGPPFYFCVASAKGGDMTVALSWEKNVVEEDDAVGMLDWLEEVLRGLAGW